MTTTSHDSNGSGLLTEEAPPVVEPEPETLDKDQFLAFLAGIPAERDLMSWLNWLARPTKRVAIVGFTDSRELTPWEDESFEKWICNDLHRIVPDTWDRLYDLHEVAEIRKNEPHEKVLRSTKKPVITWEPQPDWPTAIAYPRDEITAQFGRYFTNSISWMIAHAIWEGATDIHVYGVDMATGTEYASQRPSCEYFLGVAAGRGINVFVPAASDLLKNLTMYGAEDDTPIRAKLNARERELRTRLDAISNQRAQAQAAVDQYNAQINQLQGALENTKYFHGVWLNPHVKRDGAAPESSG